MPSLYAIKVSLTTVALVLAILPFMSSAWNYYRADKIKNLPPEFTRRRKELAYEWKGWKIVFTGAALIINSIINYIP